MKILSVKTRSDGRFLVALRFSEHNDNCKVLRKIVSQEKLDQLRAQELADWTENNPQPAPNETK